MDRTPITHIREKVGGQAKIAGFVQTIRDQGSIKFLIIRDITGTIQVVVSKASPEASRTASSLSLESVVEVVGLAKEEKQAPGGTEIQAEEIHVLSDALPELPIPVIEKGQEETDQQIRLDWRWLDLRKPEKALIFKVWTVMEQAFRNYCIGNGFIEIHSPKLTATATESGSELFEVKYFKRKANLAQSPQLYKQMAMAAGFEKVFEVGPVFRANPSATSRHDTEFTMYDVEMSFITSHHDLMNEEEKMIVAMLKAVKEKYGDEIQKVYNREVVIPRVPFPRLTIKEVKEILGRLGIPDERGGDMSPEEERAICEHIQKETGSEFLFIHEFPTSVRAFYSMRKEDDPRVTKSFDLLWNGLEITSGAQREHRVLELEKQIKEQGLSTLSFETYLNFFRYGCPPHGGFAPGPSRMLMKLLNLSNVREVTYLYRGINRLEP
ncbi:MAG: aspartate--tRNA(Asn) ligase [Candidatus Lloydbacteria bacterium RIFCSPHIGHO2_02_FULL_51_22]|uniref:Aspartate--tRNA(Asp/Asn) ligase n=2 Tax=Candidatus Lloydiibacteriota TaxID=1817910 RepID=A0A1G2DGZ9_9BACT|nr:MAG: aspartate--tRNA(Asn) ligase [Candidatus Lloydbacteria bacterium RIFCSPHIGHO2_02_FULL_51_22]OGZ14647.1 MAG: aspartate--tRNA(Asn) ligase [Candidatus Lloydbacteria bacterium RIFCSPLOWO2_02_FULL_51_11]